MKKNIFHKNNEQISGKKGFVSDEQDERRGSRGALSSTAKEEEDADERLSRIRGKLRCEGWIDSSA